MGKVELRGNERPKSGDSWLNNEEHLNQMFISQHHEQVETLGECLTSFPDAGIPPIVSQETKDLYHKSKKGEKHILELNLSARDLDNRVEIMSEAQERISKSLTEFNKILAAKVAAANTIKNTLEIKRKHVESIMSERAKIDRMIEESSLRNKRAVAHYQKKQEFLNNLITAAESSSFALSQFNRKCEEKSAEVAVVTKYAEADEQYEVQLTVKAKKHAIAVRQKQQRLHASVAETQAIQIQLSTTFETLRRLHHERQSYLKQWEDELRGMRRLDKLIADGGRAYSLASITMKKKDERIANMKELLSTLCSRSHRIKGQRSLQQKKYFRELEKSQTYTTNLERTAENTDLLRLTLNGLEAAKNSATKHEGKLLATLNERKKKLQQIQLRLESDQIRIQVERKDLNESKSLMERCQEVQSQLEDRLKKSENEEASLKSLAVKERTKLETQKKQELDTKGEISALVSLIKAFTGKTKKLQSEKEKQLELLYAVDLRFHLFQKQLLRLEGKRTKEEKKFLGNDLEMQQKRHKKEADVNSTLKNEVERCKKELRLATRSFNWIRAEYSKSVVTSQELHKELETLRKFIRNTEGEKSELLAVENDIKIEDQKLQEILKESLESYYSLENIKNQMQLSLQEIDKTSEETLRNLRAEIRIEESQRHNAALALSNESRRKKVLSARYEVIKQKYGRNDNGDNIDEENEINGVLHKLESDDSKLQEKLETAKQQLQSLALAHEQIQQCKRNIKKRRKKQIEWKSSELSRKLNLEMCLFSCRNIMHEQKRRSSHLQKSITEETHKLHEIQLQEEALHQRYKGRSLEYDKNRKDFELKKERAARASVRYLKIKRQLENTALNSLPLKEKLELLKKQMQLQSLHIQKPLIIRTLMLVFEDKSEIKEKLVEEMTLKFIQIPSKATSVVSNGEISQRSNEWVAGDASVASINGSNFLEKEAIPAQSKHIF